MDERVKKIVDILLAPKIGTRVRLLPCEHQRHFGNVPLETHMEHSVATIKEITPAIVVHRNDKEPGAEEIAYSVSCGGVSRGWWVYRHQFEVVDDGE